MEKKKVILTLCKIFPVTHSKAGELTGFEGKLKDSKKSTLSDTMQKTYGMSDIRVFPLVKSISLLGSGRADLITQNKGSYPGLMRSDCNTLL